MNLPGEWKTLQADKIESLREWACALHSLWALTENLFDVTESQD
jgi:hypothetical protein